MFWTIQIPMTIDEMTLNDVYILLLGQSLCFVFRKLSQPVPKYYIV